MSRRQLGSPEQIRSGGFQGGVGVQAERAPQGNGLMQVAQSLSRLNPALERAGVTMFEQNVEEERDAAQSAVEYARANGYDIEAFQEMAQNDDRFKGIADNPYFLPAFNKLRGRDMAREEHDQMIADGVDILDNDAVQAWRQENSSADGADEFVVRGYREVQAQMDARMAEQRTARVGEVSLQGREAILNETYNEVLQTTGDPVAAAAERSRLAREEYGRTGTEVAAMDLQTLQQAAQAGDIETARAIAEMPRSDGVPSLADSPQYQGLVAAALREAEALNEQGVTEEYRRELNLYNVAVRSGRLNLAQVLALDIREQDRTALIGLAFSAQERRTREAEEARDTTSDNAFQNALILNGLGLARSDQPGIPSGGLYSMRGRTFTNPQTGQTFSGDDIIPQAVEREAAIRLNSMENPTEADEARVHAVVAMENMVTYKPLENRFENFAMSLDTSAIMAGEIPEHTRRTFEIAMALPNNVLQAHTNERDYTYFSTIRAAVQGNMGMTLDQAIARSAVALENGTPPLSTAERARARERIPNNLDNTTNGASVRAEFLSEWENRVRFGTPPGEALDQTREAFRENYFELNGTTVKRMRNLTARQTRTVMSDFIDRFAANQGLDADELSLMRLPEQGGYTVLRGGEPYFPVGGVTNFYPETALFDDAFVDEETGEIDYDAIAASTITDREQREARLRERGIQAFDRAATMRAPEVMPRTGLDNDLQRREDAGL